MHSAIELRHLRYLLAVANELHFGRAAACLHLAAPSLSKQIRQLEAILGFLIFDRSTRAVELTPEGAVFLSQLRPAFRDLERAIDIAESAARRKTTGLIIGYTPWIDPLILQAAAIATHQQHSISVNLLSDFSPRQVARVLAGELDAGIVMLPVSVAGVAIEEVGALPLSLALPTRVLGKRKVLSLDVMTGQTFVRVGRSINPDFSEWMLQRLYDAGAAPRDIRDAATTVEALQLVAAGMGIALVNARMEESFLKGVTFCRPTGGLAVPIAVLYRLGCGAEPLNTFVQCVRASL